MATRILVIDDDPLICRLLEYQLGGAGYEVTAYQRAYEALLQLERWQPDLLLLDVMMPEISGWDLCRQIRASSNLPIIMLTAKDGDDDVVHGLTSGADDYVGKPFGQAQLIARIEAVLRRTRAATQRPRQAGLTPARVGSAPTIRPATTPSRAQVATPQPAATPSRVQVATPQPAARPITPQPASPGPAKLPRLGVQLAEARRQLGYTLHEAARASGVRWEFLQAIEQEEFAFVPHADLRRALRSYSAMLGVDLKPYVARAARRARPAPLHLTVGMAALVAIALILLAMVM